MKTISQAGKVLALANVLLLEDVKVGNFVTPKDFSLALLEIKKVETERVTLELLTLEDATAMVETTVGALGADYVLVHPDLIIDTPAPSLTSNELRGDVQVASPVAHPSGHVEFRGR